MEPKSIAFYTAVAVSILAVLSATTFPTLAQAQQQTDERQTDEPQEQPEQENNNESPARNSESQEDDSTEDSDDSNEERAADNNNNNNNLASQSRLGLDSSNGLVSCGQIVSGEVELTNDLNCNSGDGLIVGAPGTHINLNGYKITLLAMTLVHKVYQWIMMAAVEYWSQMQMVLSYQVLAKYQDLTEESHSWEAQTDNSQTCKWQTME
jgi:DNA mismatch repair ATPase MutL